MAYDTSGTGQTDAVTELERLGLGYVMVVYRLVTVWIPPEDAWRISLYLLEPGLTRVLTRLVNPFKAIVSPV